MDTSTTESLLPRTNCTPEEKKPGRKSVRIDETVDIITANSPCVLESTPLNVRETVPLAASPSDKRSQEHEYQANHHHHTNLQYLQHNHLYQQHEQQHEQQNNNNNIIQEQKFHHEAQQYQQHNNNNNNNYSQQQQQHHHHLSSSPSPPPPSQPAAKNKELRVTFSDSPLCESRYGQQASRLPKSASSNCDSEINNLNTAFQRRPIKRSQSLESRDNPFVPGGELAIDTDDILKRATIVRDKFILDEQEKQKAENAMSSPVQDKTDGPSGKDVGKSPDTKDPGKDLPKENGKVEEEKAEEQATRPPSGGQTGDLQDTPKEKKKQKKKCCTIM